MTTPTPTVKTKGLAADEFPVTPIKPERAAAALALAGFPPDQWATGVAVGMGESGLNMGAQNKSTGSVGWLQIRKSAHPDLFKGMQTGYEWLDPITNAKMAKSVYDAAHGWGPWQAYTGPDGKGSDGPWKKYQSEGEAAAAALQKGLQGKTQAEQQKFLHSLADPYTEVARYYILGVGENNLANAIGTAGGESAKFAVDSGAAVASSIKSLVDEFTAISELFQKLLLPSTWIRIGAGAIGVMLLIAGMVTLGKEASATS